MKICPCFLLCISLGLWTPVKAEKILVPDFGEVEVVTDPQDSFLYMHEKKVNGFLKSSGFGFERGNTPVPGVHGAIVSSPSFWQDESFIRSIKVTNLVSLLQDATPRVYLVDWRLTPKTMTTHDIGHPDSTDSYAQLGVTKSAVEHEDVGEKLRYFRTLDSFEHAALDQLALGQKLVIWRQDKLIRGFGAIRAMKTCLECHTRAKEGDLLGAFTYFMKKEKQPSQSALETAGIRTSIQKLLADGAPHKAYWDLLYKTHSKPPPEINTPSGIRYIEHGLASYGTVTPGMLEYTNNEREDIGRISTNQYQATGRSLDYRGGYPRRTREVSTK